VPEDVSAAARNTIYTRRGRVERNLTEDGFSEIRAVVPLSELLASDSGIAVYPMEFVGYEPVQDNGFSDEDGSGVTANKPNRPRPSSRSETARPDNN
jgi:translation elongation factor EF-G